MVELGSFLEREEGVFKLIITTLGWLFGLYNETAKKIGQNGSFFHFLNLGVILTNPFKTSPFPLCLSIYCLLFPFLCVDNVFPDGEMSWRSWMGATLLVGISEIYKMPPTNFTSKYLQYDNVASVSRVLGYFYTIKPTGK